jgi:hypothetical protein
VPRSVLATLTLVGGAFVACQVYEPSLLTGGPGTAGRGAGASGGASSGTGGALAGGNGVGGSALGGTDAGGAASGATGGGGTSNAEAGAGGEGDEPGGGTGGVGGGLGGASGVGGTSGSGGTAGASGGGAGSGGASGKGGGAGTSGVGGSAGTPATGGAGAGGAGSGGAGGAGAGAGGAGGMAGNGGSGRTVVELMGTATADSEQAWTNEMHPATLGNDGDLATRWCAADGNANHYWTVDLGSVHEVTRFEVTWEYPSQATGLPYLYRLDVSSNGTNFTMAVDKRANAEVTKTQSVNFPAGTMARHVRIVVTGLPQGSSPTWASFFEASVFGY